MFGSGEVMAIGESSHVLSVETLPTSDSEMEVRMSPNVSGHVDCVRIDAASDFACDASEPVQARDGTLVVLSSVVADRTDTRATGRDHR